MRIPILVSLFLAASSAFAAPDPAPDVVVLDVSQDIGWHDPGITVDLVFLHADLYGLRILDFDLPPVREETSYIVELEADVPAAAERAGRADVGLDLGVRRWRGVR